MKNNNGRVHFSYVLEKPQIETNSKVLALILFLQLDSKPNIPGTPGAMQKLTITIFPLLRTLYTDISEFRLEHFRYCCQR